jgi:protein involved in polysaccharide export with SLBB domain
MQSRGEGAWPHWKWSEMIRSIAHLLVVTLMAMTVVACSGNAPSLESNPGPTSSAPPNNSPTANSPSAAESPATTSPSIADPPIGSLTTEAPVETAPPSDPDQYQLGPGDKVRVLVFNENDLSGEFVVDSSGSVNLPLIGAVAARGATVREFQDRVVTKLRDGYLKDPKVSIEVLNYRPFFITGEVKSGGEYPYKAGLTVQDAVGVAGGYTYRANTKTAYIRRAGQDREQEVKLSQRVPIKPGDSIRIPERFF